MNRLITIVGPTAVGKTELTLRLAHEFQSPIISGDAYQVYKQLNIGTAKPTAEELASAQHYLIDILEPDDSYSVSVFQEQAKQLISECNDRSEIPILSGGTGLYVQSLLENYGFNDTKPNPELREQLDELYDTEGIEGLRTHAEHLAKQGEITLVLQDKHRLYRAIELMSAGDYDALRHQTKDGLSFEGPVIGLIRNRDELYERINLRVDLMFEAGLVAEVEQILANGVSPNCQAFKGIGYKEVVQHLYGDISLDECRELIQKNTRHFAKRQITWYKRMPYIQWIHIERGMTGNDVYTSARQLCQFSN